MRERSIEYCFLRSIFLNDPEALLKQNIQKMMMIYSNCIIFQYDAQWFDNSPLWQ